MHDAECEGGEEGCNHKARRAFGRSGIREQRVVRGQEVGADLCGHQHDSIWRGDYTREEPRSSLGSPERAAAVEETCHEPSNR